MEMMALMSGVTGGTRVSGMLAFVICLVCHQALLFAIGRWTVELDGWRATSTALAGVAGLSIGSVTMSGLLAPLAACLAAFVVMRLVYPKEENGGLAMRLQITQAQRHGSSGGLDSGSPCG